MLYRRHQCINICYITCENPAPVRMHNKRQLEQIKQTKQMNTPVPYARQERKKRKRKKKIKQMNTPVPYAWQAPT